MKKLIIASLLLTSLFSSQALALTVTDHIFTDVNQASSYYESIKYLKDAGIISGYADGSFKPYQTINRAEFTKIVIGATGYNPAQDPSGFDIMSTNGLTFKDLQEGAWYNPFLRQGVQLGVIGGYPDGTFKPDQEINFAEASKIIVVAHGGDFAGAGYAPEDWFHKYVNVLEEAHAIPTTINSFDQKISRGEMAEIIFRLKSEDSSKPSMTYAELAAPKGYLEGSLSYPSEGIPTDLMICADRIEVVESYCTNQHLKNQKYLYGVGYKLPVPAGTYNVYAQVGNISGSYSEFVTCGMDSKNCSSHQAVDVKVETGKTVKDIDPADWTQNQ